MGSTGPAAAPCPCPAPLCPAPGGPALGLPGFVPVQRRAGTRCSLCSVSGAMLTSLSYPLPVLPQPPEHCAPGAGASGCNKAAAIRGALCFPPAVCPGPGAPAQSRSLQSILRPHCPAAATRPAQTPAPNPPSVARALLRSHPQSSDHPGGLGPACPLPSSWHCTVRAWRVQAGGHRLMAMPLSLLCPRAAPAARQRASRRQRGTGVSTGSCYCINTHAGEGTAGKRKQLLIYCSSTPCRIVDCGVKLLGNRHWSRQTARDLAAGTT